MFLSSQNEFHLFPSASSLLSPLCSYLVFFFFFVYRLRAFRDCTGAQDALWRAGLAGEGGLYTPRPPNVPYGCPSHYNISFCQNSIHLSSKHIRLRLVTET